METLWENRGLCYKWNKKIKPQEKKAKAVLRMKFMVIRSYLRKQEKLQIKQFIFLIISKWIRKRRTKQRSKFIREKERVNTRVEINKIEIKKKK